MRVPPADAQGHTPADHDDRDELDEDIGEPVGGVDRSQPTDHERGGGAGKEFAILAIVTGVLGVVAAVELMLDYLRILADPNYVPACDINPLVGCGVFLGSWQSSALGIPNTVIGMLTFPVVIATGILLLTRVRLPRWYWRGLVIGATFGIVFVTWLQYQAITQIRALCPYCLVVWLVMIPFFVHTVARAMQNGALPAPEGLKSFVVPNRWLITAIWYLLVVAAAAFGLGEEWLLVF
ncbi:vitamin K epoxide reductase family protein [Ruania halotolerans]|uniref:vitamin K epoxide reductase family protein n=1 Tax=Ruania halotolerans TaxID=2897773 RepID=UPI001E4EBFD8|nr:vitamin K epoxide reductase family protein [Ruania halotolerans]UFU04969.1 vitamin K epoxide reductase family protein [Ruania halotolerans]